MAYTIAATFNCCFHNDALTMFDLIDAELANIDAIQPWPAVFDPMRQQLKTTVLIDTGDIEAKRKAVIKTFVAINPYVSFDVRSH